MSKRKGAASKLKPSKLNRKQASVKKSTRQKSSLGNRVRNFDTGCQYNESQQVLCVGEGNFSFARALVRLLQAQGQQLVATAYDTEETVLAKYEEGPDPVSEIVQELQDCNAAVCYAVDATQLAKSLQLAIKKQHLRNLPQAFDRIVFNFPHVGLGIKDQDVNVRKNQQMLSSFFFSACEVLKPDGEIHVTLKGGKPYLSWNIVSLAHHATQGVLTLKTTRPFDAEQYPGYSHRRTLGFKEGLSSQDNEEIDDSSRTYVFRLQA